MSYIALYRKYRSQTFSELMGQEQVTVTLQNSIRSGRIAHAYLFYGARGCGKTSTARLLARALNCVAQDGPTPEPCGECTLCVAIRNGACMDVNEMDAASETGIDDVREKIVENVQYAPTEARYKVYIIDEVHDLSTKAFDALLKTLEEPPPHVIFILATTEPHKVPITIRSRCTNYHFKRGTLGDLSTSIQKVIDKEECTAEPEAVQAIARAAEGSWRDALSLLEQVLAYSDGRITAGLVHQAIGTVGTETLTRVTATLATGDWCATLEIAGELIDSGKDVRQLLAALSGHIRDLMLICAGAHAAAKQELGAERYEALSVQAPLFDPFSLLAMTAILSAAEREVRFTNQHRWLLESTLLRLMPSNLNAAAMGTLGRSAGRASATALPRLESTSATPRNAARTETVAEQRVREVDSPAPADIQTEYAEKTGAVLSVRTPAQTTHEPASRFADNISIEVLHRAWPRILSLFKKASPQGAPFLEKGELAELDGHTIVLSFADAFAKDRIQNNSRGKLKVEDVVNQALGSTGLKIRCISRDPDSPLPTSPQPTVPPIASGMGGLLESSAESDPVHLPKVESTHAAGSIRDPVTAASAPSGSKSGADTLGASTDDLGAAVSLARTDSTAEGGLLADALLLFGGTVVRTEPRVDS